jgi:type I restriction enzyme, R subunit
MFIEKRESKVKDDSGANKLTVRETLVFPRYHQLDSVRKLVAAARKEGAGNNYLIQHSAGSGKTNSISWLSHRLASLHNDKDEKTFDCVVVITDRQVLDRQLQDAIYQIEHAQGVVKAIDQDSKQLADALVDGTRIVVTTLQKFPFVLKGLLHNLSGGRYEDLSSVEQLAVKEKAGEYETKISARRYAVIVDEAHSSQTGEMAGELKAILGSGMNGLEDEQAGGEVGAEDVLNKVMESRGKQKNLSFFAFTATPKGKTLNLFGRMGSSGKPGSFHTYSMRQAIEEGFILDVLKSYTTYKTYYGLVKAIEDDPKLPQKKARKSLAKFMSLHPHNIEQKTEVMVEHFRQNVQSRIGGRAKAMVVTDSRLAAVRYMISFKKYIEENSYIDIRPLVAFSGTVKDPATGLEYTEPGMNTDAVTRKSISESQLPKRFDSADYQILLVANKYQTGFDQPLLQAMYVDKRLADVQAVQTLSRLNRPYPGKEAPFVLDFVNDPDDIYDAFKPYYDTTMLQNVAKPEQLETLKYEMDEMQVYHWSEVEAFASVFYKPQIRHSIGDHARMERHLQPAVDRFKALEDEEQQAFRDKLGGYVHLYTFLSQIMPWTDPDLEKLYSFGRFLLSHLPIGKDVVMIHPEDDVALRYYRLERVSSGGIELDTQDMVEVKSPTDVGTGKAHDEDAPLSDIIGVLNERFGTEFGEEDRLFFEQIKEKALGDQQIVRTAEANPIDKFELGIRQAIESLMIQRMSENDEIVSRYMDDQDFQNAIFPLLAKEIFTSARMQEDR